MKKELTIGGIISYSIVNGLKNAISIFGAFILWVLTIWIPYINVGTTICLFSALPIALSKGEMISPAEIFKAKYRNFMGEYFILSGLKGMGIYLGLLFMFFPGIVLAYAWSLSSLLLIDKEINPAEALSLSNKLTKGNKWTMFFGDILIMLMFIIVIAIIGFIFMKISMILNVIIVFLLFIILISARLNSLGYVYKILTEEETPTIID